MMHDFACLTPCRVLALPICSCCPPHVWQYIPAMTPGQHAMRRWYYKSMSSEVMHQIGIKNITYHVKMSAVAANQNIAAPSEVM